MRNSLSAHSDGSVAVTTLESHVSAIRRNNELPRELFDKIEAVIGDYCHFRSIRHGENVVIAGVKTSWHFNNDYLQEDAHVTVCFKQRHERVNDCYVDEVPPSFLDTFLRLSGKSAAFGIQDQQKSKLRHADMCLQRKLNNLRKRGKRSGSMFSHTMSCGISEAGL